MYIKIVAVYETRKKNKIQYKLSANFQNRVRATCEYPMYN